MTPDQIIQRGEEAKRLLGNKMLVEVLDSMEREVVEAWESCPARDLEGREEYWKFYRTVKKFRSVLQGAVESGRIEIHRQKSLRESAVEYIRKTVRR